MLQRPEVSLIVVTYQMPGHLRRVLASIEAQTVLEAIEIVVTDDGSTDDTRSVVANFSRRIGRPIPFVTHPHDGFHLTRCRNDGARLATAPYLLFLDGDCILPPDHVEQYLKARREGVVHYGYCCRLEKELSEQIDEAAIASGEFLARIPASELGKLRKMHWKSLFYQWLRHATKPVLKGGNIGIWRSDFERLNGFDENFKAWGCEDDDLSYRVRAAGLKVASVLGRTRTFHLWHPPASTRPAARWSDGPNVPYLKRRGRLTRCMHGLQKRSLGDLRIARGREGSEAQDRFVRQVFGRAIEVRDRPEIELCFDPSRGFAHKSQCRVLVTDHPQQVNSRVLDQADLVLPANPSIAREKLLAAFANSANKAEGGRRKAEVA